jgi:hypothetical protein
MKSLLVGIRNTNCMERIKNINSLVIGNVFHLFDLLKLFSGCEIVNKKPSIQCCCEESLCSLCVLFVLCFRC